jgi:putative transposase
MDEMVAADARTTSVRPVPTHKLSEAEREQMLAVANSDEFASLPPSQIVPTLADRGVYLASESSFYRVLKQASQQHHRGRSKKPSERVIRVIVRTVRIRCGVGTSLGCRLQ